MLQDLFETKIKIDNHKKFAPIYDSFESIANRAENKPLGMYKQEYAKILSIVNKILDFNEKNQPGKGLKILTPYQMLSRLSISLAQLKAGNNSEKLKNEIRQLLYSLHRSK